MKKIIVNQTGDFENLQYAEAPVPVIEPDEILVQVISIGVNPVDFKGIKFGFFGEGYTPGTDIAGIVKAVGNRIIQFKAGDEVFGSLEWNKQGAFSEYVVTQEKYIALKPKTSSFQESSAVPLAALTAWQALFEHAKLESSQKILIHAAAGGVGSFAVQLAKWKDAYVIGTASEKNTDFLKSIGVDEVIDYTKENFAEKLKDIDVVLDTISDRESEIQENSFKVLKKSGFYVSITAPPRKDSLQKFGIKGTNFLFRSDPNQLNQIAELIDTGKVKVFIDKEFKLADAKSAIEYVALGKTRGKVILNT
jgi:NADPH:quinone reductase-like Zn-dependent oxidoreductase